MEGRGPDFSKALWTHVEGRIPDFATALSSHVESLGPDFSRYWPCRIEWTAVASAKASQRLPWAGQQLKIVAVAQFGARQAKPADTPLPHEAADLGQFERAYPVAAVLSTSGPKEFDAPSLAQSLQESGQIPEGFRLLRVVQVESVAIAESDAKLTPKPQRAQPEGANPFRDDGGERAPGGGTTLSALGFAPVTRLTIDTRIKPDPNIKDEIQQPKDEAAQLFRQFGERRDYMQVGDEWLDESVYLEAARFCHQPLYFEELNLERYGTSRRPLLQPIISGARFFATVPALPYLMTVERPGACCCREGECPAGRPAPWHRELPPLRLDAAAVTGLVATGMVFLVP